MKVMEPKTPYHTYCETDISPIWSTKETSYKDITPPLHQLPPAQETFITNDATRILFHSLQSLDDNEESGNSTQEPITDTIVSSQNTTYNNANNHNEERDKHVHIHDSPISIEIVPQHSIPLSISHDYKKLRHQHYGRMGDVFKSRALPISDEDDDVDNDNDNEWENHINCTNNVHECKDNTSKSSRRVSFDDQDLRYNVINDNTPSIHNILQNSSEYDINNDKLDISSTIQTKINSPSNEKISTDNINRSM